MTVTFGLLGTTEARIDGLLVEDLGHSRQRHVLAALLVDANGPVSTKQLIDRVWAGRPPQRALGTLYSCISRLRRALAPAAEDVRIARQAGGYLLTVDASAVDLHHFRRLVAQAGATHRDEQAVDLLEQALGLWRGEAFAAADTPWFNALRAVAHQERLAVELDLADIRLRRGDHARLLSELSARAQQHPLDERVAGQLMTALYRSGRAAEALNLYQAVRRRLADELGTDPGPALQQLHQQVLTAAPALAAPAPRSVTRSTPPPTPVPRQLPAPPPLFTGRTRELGLLDSRPGPSAGQTPSVAIFAIGGVGGIGKTWLALHWAHENLECFPDGQLYVNLRGFTPLGEPVQPQTAVRGFLDALGADPATVPADPDAQAALYRSLTAGKRLLIVLDDARDTAQVAPLLPGSPTCTVIVTSRSRLAGLAVAHGARPLTLDTLTDTEARHLLARYLGTDRVAAEPDDVTALLGHCAGLPLAIGILAARATMSPDVRLTELAAELHEEQTRLDALYTGDLTADLRTVFAASYRALDPDVARMFRLLGLAPGPDISLPATACLTSLSMPRARALLRGLEAAHLIQESVAGRYRMHDLVRLYAAERTREEPAESGDEALPRLLDFYLHSAHAATGRLDPHRDRVHLTAPRHGVTPQDPADHGAALAWFTAEHPVLLSTVDLAVSTRYDTHAWQLAHALETFFDYRGHWHDWAAVQHTALDAGRRLGDRSWQAGSHRSLGSVYTQMGLLEDGHAHFSRALELYGQLGDQVSQAHTHRGLGWVCDRKGLGREALDHNEQALAHYRQTGHRAGQARSLNNAGWMHIMLSDYRRGLDYCAQAVALNQEIGDRHGEAGAWDSLGYAHHHLAEYTDAIRCYQQALDLDREFGDRYGETEILGHLGDTHLAVGDPDAARVVWSRALDVADEIGHPSIDDLRARLNALPRAGLPADRAGQRPGPQLP
ncbi:AfsR/SARP family transcriptional regulator [Streptomyces edwardsiae]|uniref:BTAD domain-containing putative transcriptional regulator n=1 Tax=Streptomyces edwardsiae TaxID=3075527 RepID=A0ABU2Q9F8_9ACTN|nr:BTAD domain-containing putative transcriptional regulator [Streptomyces sp. DSM 41635]MDT0401034.1 BTAD domain-containing putative transcriptional regulator [Streptomyces sp. DSM 41635]